MAKGKKSTNKKVKKTVGGSKPEGNNNSTEGDKGNDNSGEEGNGSHNSEDKGDDDSNGEEQGGDAETSDQVLKKEDPIGSLANRKDWKLCRTYGWTFKSDDIPLENTIPDDRLIADIITSDLPKAERNKRWSLTFNTKVISTGRAPQPRSNSKRNGITYRSTAM